jgi:hypothetical protein
VILIGIQPQTMQGQITELVKEGAEHLISLLKHGHIEQIQSV